MKIRKLFCFDYPKIKKMISYTDDNFTKSIMSDTVGILNYVLPLKYKFKSESYILLDNDEILGLITVIPTTGNPYKLNITRLIFKQDFYNVGKQLIDFVVAKYGSKGANSFTVYVDESHDELCNLLLNGCGFRQCAYENLWRLDNFEKGKSAPFRCFQNEDAIKVCELYNSELNTLYKPSMERIPTEYIEPVLGGFNDFYKNRYVLEDNHRIIAYLSITTVDNCNFIIDISTNDGYNISYDEVISFGLNEVASRRTRYNVFLKHRQYAKNADKLEEYLHSKNLNCVQTQCVFTKDFYRPIKETENVLKVFELKVLSNQKG